LRIPGRVLHFGINVISLELKNGCENNQLNLCKLFLLGEDHLRASLETGVVQGDKHSSRNRILAP